MFRFLLGTRLYQLILEAVKSEVRAVAVHTAEDSSTSEPLVQDVPATTEPASLPPSAMQSGQVQEKKTRVTAAECLKRFGPPESEREMVLWVIPQDIYFSSLPKRIYCNKLMVPMLAQAFENVRERGLTGEVRTWDGCFNIRKSKGGKSLSVHAWGMGIDINAAWNGFNKTPTMSPALVACFTDAGFEWGGTWSRPDGMHFQPAFI